MGESRRPPQKTAPGSSGTRLSNACVASVTRTLCRRRARPGRARGRISARRPGILSSELAPNWTRIRDGRMIMPRARRPSYRHRHLPLYGRRGLDEASAATARRRGVRGGARRASPRRPRGVRGLKRESRSTRRETPFFFAFPTASGAVAAALAMTEGLCRGPDPPAHRSPHGDTACHRRGLRGRRRPLRREGRRLRVTVARSCSRRRPVRSSTGTTSPISVSIGSRTSREQSRLSSSATRSFPPLKTISNTNLPQAGEFLRWALSGAWGCALTHRKRVAPRHAHRAGRFGQDPRLHSRRRRHSSPPTRRRRLLGGPRLAPRPLRS